jgi:hypothetical protein
MKTFRTVTGTTLVMAVLLVALSGCEKGPAQKAGENVDNAVEDLGKSLEGMGDSIQGAGRDARD